MNYFLTYTFLVVVVSVLMGISTWKLFKKMGYNPLFAFIPFYNYYIILKETKHPKWWAALSYVPIVGPIMMTVFHIFLMKKFGKGLIQHQLLTVFFPFIYMAFVNYSKETELEDETEYHYATDGVPEKKKESFLGSITFAVVFATLIHVFVAQPFGIPTGSMERTLLVGDFLFVNKLNYGFRMPMRPLAIPFLQGTIMDTGVKGNPKDDPKSYVDAVKLPYLRLPGWETPKKNDIVVFNYPQDSVHTATDRKDPYVKRCVAVGGDTVEMRDGRLFVNGKAENRMADADQQHAYFVQASTELDIQGIFKKMGFISILQMDPAQFDPKILAEYNLDPKNTLYRMDLTDDRVKFLKSLPEVISVTEDIEKKGLASVRYYNAEKTRIDTTNSIFPINKNWNQDQYGPLKIPKKGDVVPVNQSTLPMYRWIITEYEHNHLENKNGQIFINNQPATTYTIRQNYYMMMGDNRDASLDARFFGFVPEENIIGKPMFTWFSLEGAFKDSNASFQADKLRVRWDRMFEATNTGEKEKTSYWWIAALVLILFFGWEYFAKLFRKKKGD